MFSGIVKSTGTIKKILSYKNGKSIGVKTNLKISQKDIGASINCSGTCLTLEKINRNLYFFYISKETLKVTNFKKIKMNQVINMELSLKYGNPISGHFVQGHVDTTSILKEKKIVGKSWYLYFSMNKKLKKFIIYKGSVAINGISLTISKILRNKFLVVIIPHTMRLTNLRNIKVKDLVNVEIDILTKYIKKFSK